MSAAVRKLYDVVSELLESKPRFLRYPNWTESIIQHAVDIRAMVETHVEANGAESPALAACEDALDDIAENLLEAMDFLVNLANNNVIMALLRHNSTTRHFAGFKGLLLNASYDLRQRLAGPESGHEETKEQRAGDFEMLERQTTEDDVKYYLQLVQDEPLRDTVEEQGKRNFAMEQLRAIFNDSEICSRLEPRILDSLQVVVSAEDPEAARDALISRREETFRGNRLPAGSVRIGAYIGRGSFGAVYRGHISVAGEPEQLCAIKKLPQAVQDTVHREQRLMEEILTCASLRHPNVAAIFGYSHMRLRAQQSEVLCMVMEFAAAGSLQEMMSTCQGDGRLAVMTRDGNRLEAELTVRAILQLFHEMALGLEHVHESCIVHRDIKPHNILLSDRLTPKIADFGYARVIRDDSIGGTTPTNACGEFKYVAPELVAFFTDSVPVRYHYTADIFSLGRTMLEVSHRVFSLHDGPVPSFRTSGELPPTLPTGLSNIIRTAMTKRPANRYGRGSVYNRLLSGELEWLISHCGGPPHSDRQEREKLRVVCDVAIAQQENRVRERTPVQLLSRGESGIASRDRDVAKMQLLDAARDGDDHMVQAVVLEHGTEAMMNVVANSMYSESPLHLAAGAGHLHICRILLEDGCRHDVEDAQGSTPMHYAASQGHAAVVRCLIDVRADVNCEDRYRNLPLHRAANLDIVRILVGAGSHVLSKNLLGETPLEALGKSGHFSAQALDAVAAVLTDAEAEAVEMRLD